MKVCRICEQTKNESEFYKNRRVCKQCHGADVQSWKSANKERQHEYTKKHKLVHRDQSLERDRTYHKKAYETHHEAILVRNKSWASKNIERLKTYIRDWKLSHQEDKRVYQQNRRAREKGNGGSYTVREWLDLCEKYNNLCLRCGEKVKLTPDHIVPISKGGSSDITNIQPLCQKCNSWKKAKTIDYRT